MTQKEMIYMRENYNEYGALLKMAQEGKNYTMEEVSDGICSR